MRNQIASLLFILIILHPGLFIAPASGNTLILANQEIKIYLPVVQHIPAPNFEAEPNSTTSQANGPLQIGVDYTGYPNDSYDFYFVDVTRTGTIFVDLTSHTGTGVQLQFRDLEIANPLQYDYDPPYSIRYNINKLGRYYIVIFTSSGFNTTNIYHLTVSYQ